MPHSDEKLALVIDDEEDIREIIGVVMEEMGFRCETAHNGQVGLEKALSLRPSLVLVDWNLPLMSGVDIIRKLRANPETAKIPTLILTGEVRPDSIKEALDAGAWGHIAKPFEPDDLIRAVEAILST
ncbi:MAG: response regulator [Candidatus Omnitrophica bacterium]|nr:response regulator [Candidatus Omnitrophota bacterium]